MPTKKYGPSDTTSGSPEPCGPDVSVPTNLEYVGRVFKDRYYISKELGRGNIGVVYLAEDRQLHCKPVVIKVLLDTSNQNLWFQRKFNQEIEALSRVDHPGVVNVTDSGVTPDGKSFLVMQLIRGENLRAMIKQDGMDLELVATIVRQSGQAITAAHAEGIIHCDLKPENIMLQDLGEGEYQVKIVDFGVAKVQNSQVTALTPGTCVAGTPFYMAPEQYEGKPCHASHIFAFGVITYEMLTGRRPFNPATQHQIRAGVRIAPQDLRPAIPDRAQELILKALSFDPASRPQRARDFGEMLAEELSGSLSPSANIETGSERGVELAHVLFIDLMCSRLPTKQQTSILSRAQQIVNTTESLKRAKAANRLISRPTGDAITLVFFGGPNAPAECALEIARAVKTEPAIKLRMGINSGPVSRVPDLNQAGAATGAGINIAQQLADRGDPGHILVSRATAKVLGESREWNERLHDVGAHNLKSGGSVHLFNLYDGELGNSAIPGELHKKRRRALVVAGAAVLVLAVMIIVNLVWLSSPRSNTPPARSAIIARTLSYSLVVYRNKGAPLTVPDFNRIFELKYKFKFNVTTPQPGYFYVLKEGRPDPSSGPPYTLLYRSNAGKGNRPLTRITAPEPAKDWFEFDKNNNDKLWLVWSENAVPELEAVKGLSNQQTDQIKDARQTRLVHDVLALYGTSKLEKVTDAEKTTLTGTEAVLVYQLNLEHQ